MRFHGFGEAAFDLYDDLSADPTKAFWEEHKGVWESDVRDPMKALVDDLGPEFGEAKVFRPYRDVRFSKDKTPIKDHQGAVVEDDESGALYVQVSAAGVLVAGGMWRLTPDQVQRWRAAVADEATRLDAVLDPLVDAGWQLPEPALVRVPKPWDAEHPREALLRCRQAALSRQFPPAARWHTAKGRTVVADAWRDLAPLRAWLARHVGAPCPPASDGRRPTLPGRS